MNLDLGGIAPGLHRIDNPDSEEIPKCPKCGGNLKYVFKMNDNYFIVPVLCKCQKAAYEEKEREREKRSKDIEKNRVNDMLGNIGTLSEITFDKLEDCKPVKIAKRYLKYWPQFQKEGMGLCFWGDCGTGKTATAAALINGLKKQYGISTLIINVPTLVNNLTSVELNQKKFFVDELNRPQVLLLDDFGVERVTQFVMEVTYNLLNARYIAHKPIIITTNLTPDFFSGGKNLSLDIKRCTSRIQEMCQLVQAEKNYRKIVAEEKKKKLVELLING